RHPDVGLHAGCRARRRAGGSAAAPQAVHDTGARTRAEDRVRTRADRAGADRTGADMSRPRVLIVDDDEQICFVASRALEAIAICDCAHDVAEALRALERQFYDLALVDVTLPGPSGMTLLDELRRQWPQTTAVILSG